MKQQGLVEPLKGESYKQSTLKSELAKKEKFIKELEKEIEVIFNYIAMCMCVYKTMDVRVYVRMYIYT